MALIKNFYIDTTKGLDVVLIMHEIRRVMVEAALAEGGSVTVAIPNAGAGLLILDQADSKENAKKALEPLLTSKQLPYLLPKTLHLPVDKGKMSIEPWQDVVLVDYDTSAKRREFRVQAVAEAAAAAKDGGQKGVPLGKIG